MTWIRETLASTSTIEEVLARLKDLSPEQSEIEAQNDAKMILDIDPESIAYFMNDRVFENFDLEQLLPQVSCPTLLVRGEPELGSLVRDSDVALLEALLPYITTIQVGGIGHGICWGLPGKTTLDHITQFLNSR